jgi:indole-3-glycerol phosphate synthase
VKGTHLEKLVSAAMQMMFVRATATPLPEIKAKAKDTPPPRPFAQALIDARARGAALIAEIKRASPSKGPLAPDLDPAELARAYAAGGAACLSVLTDRTHFGGSLDDLVKARAACALPALRKDFLVTPYQLYEARAFGADAILLIAAALTPHRLAELRELARELSLCVLCEVHDEDELAAAAACKPDLLGINARSLKTLIVDPGTFARLEPSARGIAPLVAESGVKTAEDVRGYAAAGASAFLVGEALATAKDPVAATRGLSLALPPAVRLVPPGEGLRS